MQFCYSHLLKKLTDIITGMSNTPTIDAINAVAREAEGKHLNHKSRRPIMGRDDNKFRANWDRIFKRKHGSRRQTN